MSRSILVPFDGGGHAESALRYATDAFDSPSITVLYVSNVLEEPGVEATTAKAQNQADSEYSPAGVPAGPEDERGEAILESAREVGAEQGVEIETEHLVGVPHRAVVEFAADRTVDHVVIGGHGRTAVNHPFLGGVSETVVRRSPVSTTIVPLDPSEYETVDVHGDVLVPVDGSDQSTRALEYARETFPGASITVLHVVSLPFEYSREELGGSTLERLLSRLTGRGEAVVDDTIEDAGIDPETVDTAITYGKPPQSIVDYGLDYAFDQVVMGIHGRAKSKRLVTGSVAETVARRAGFPLTLVR